MGPADYSSGPACQNRDIEVRRSVPKLRYISKSSKLPLASSCETLEVWRAIDERPPGLAFVISNAGAAEIQTHMDLQNEAGDADGSA